MPPDPAGTPSKKSTSPVSSEYSAPTTSILLDKEKPVAVRRDPATGFW
jgi:hypothetical protein